MLLDSCKIRLLSLIVPFVLFMHSSGQSQVSFTENLIDDDFDAAGLYACDIDGDGDMDVFGAGINRGIAYWRNDGGYPVQWTRYTIERVFSGACSVFATDIDSDGDIDVLGAAWYDHEIACWRNDGGDPIEWTKLSLANDFDNAHEVYAADIDGDESIDVLGASGANNEIAYWLNNGGDPSTWTKYAIDQTCGGARSVFASDIDNDQDFDVLSACFSSDEYRWYRNDGGNPIVWTECSVPGYSDGAHKILTCDMDFDGDPDILGAAALGNDITWWENEGGDPVQWTMRLIDGNFNGALTLYHADFDNDYDIDVVGAAVNAADIAWWRNDGGEPFEWTEFTIDPYFQGAWPVFACDIDGDGDDDVLAGSTVTYEVVWWENDLVMSVPTLSEWGSLIFVLLFMAAGTVAVIRRKGLSHIKEMSAGPKVL